MSNHNPKVYFTNTVASTFNFCFSTAEKEEEVLTKFYDRLVIILPVRNIMPNLITERVVTFKENEQIQIGHEAEFILTKIQKSLRVGITKSFYSLLDVMEQYGNDDVKELVTDIKRALKIGELIINTVIQVHICMAVILLYCK